MNWPDGILFDLDGTLLDTLTDIAVAANLVLTSMGQTVYAVDEYRTFVGDGVGVLFDRIYPDCLVDPDLRSRCIQAFHQQYDRSWNQTSKPYLGIPELLDALSAASVPMAVLSNKPHAFTCRIVETLLKRWRFQKVVGQLPDVPCKPDPTSAKGLISEVGWQASRTAYAGDTNTDMQTASRTGCIAIGVTWGFRTQAELEASGADHIVHSPSELWTLLQTLSD